MILDKLGRPNITTKVLNSRRGKQKSQKEVATEPGKSSKKDSTRVAGFKMKQRGHEPRS